MALVGRTNVLVVPMEQETTDRNWIAVIPNVFQLVSKVDYPDAVRRAMSLPTSYPTPDGSMEIPPAIHPHPFMDRASDVAILVYRNLVIGWVGAPTKEKYGHRGFLERNVTGLRGPPPTC